MSVDRRCWWSSPRWWAGCKSIRDDLKAQTPQIREDTRLVAGLVDAYADASPDLWDGRENAVTTARTSNTQWSDIASACRLHWASPTRHRQFEPVRTVFHARRGGPGAGRQFGEHDQTHER